MAKKGREFNEIYDLTAMRVIVERSGEEGTRDCYGALGLIHSLWKPMPGRFKDYIAMPKLNRYRALHTTVIGPEGRPLEIQVRTREMHETAEFGVAAHWGYKSGKKDGKADEEWLAWVRQLMDWQEDETDPREFLKAFRTDLFDDEVYVFTPKGEVKTLPSSSTPIDFAYAVHTDVGHRTVGAKINGRIVPLHYRLKSGDFVEILTTKSGRGPSRDWMSLAASSRARNKIRQWFSRETREETEQKGRETLETALKKQNLPYKKLQGSAVLAQVIRESGFKKAEDFYLALGSGKLQPGQIVNKVIQRLKTEQVAEEEAVPLKAPKARHAISSENFGINVRGVDDVLVRLAKCCTPLPGDKIVGYISLGKGITIHREDCSNVKALKRNPERFTQGLLGRRRDAELPRADLGRLVGPAAAARGRGPHLRRARREHRRVRRPRRGPAGEELVRGGGRRREGAALAADRAPQRRRGLRRVPRDPVLEPKANPSIEGSSLERAGYLERGMALFARADYNVRRGEGSSRKRLRRPRVPRTAGGRPARPAGGGRPGAPGTSTQRSAKTTGGLPPSFARGTSAQKRPWTTGVDRDHAAPGDDRHRAARCATAHLDDRAREVDRVKLGSRGGLPRTSDRAAPRSGPTRVQGRARPAGAEQPQLSLQRLLAQP